MRRIALLPMLAVLSAISLPASAQLSDNSGLYDRIDRLERDIQTLQAQVARGGAPSSTVVTSPALGGGSSTSYGNHAAAGTGNVSGNMAVQLSDRLDQMEEQLRQLTGKVEEAGYKAAQVSQQMQRMQADVDLRFKELQGGAGGAPGQAQAPAGSPIPLAAAAGGGAAGAAAGANGADNGGPAPGPQVLGTMPTRDMKAGTAPAATQAPAAAVQFKDPQAMYDDAYAKIQKADYDGAEAQFKAFVAKYPNHQLASNADYWIADIAFTRKDFKQSAGMFLEAYKKYPKSSKAPDMLYKAGASFARLDPPRKAEACTAFKLLFDQHPQMAEHVRREALADKKKLACP